MFELLLAIMGAIGITRYAIFKDASAIFWALVGVFCIGVSLAVVPLPFIRVIVAVVAVIIAIEARHRTA